MPILTRKVIMATHHSVFSTGLEYSKTVLDIADLMRQHGALENPPHWDKIEVNRLSGQSRPRYSEKTTMSGTGSRSWKRLPIIMWQDTIILEEYLLSSRADINRRLML